MRRVTLTSLQPGAELAKTLLNERGDALLEAETRLTERYLALLRERGVRHLYVHDPDTDDLVPEELVPEQLHVHARQKVADFYATIEHASQRASLAPAVQSPADLQQALRSGEFRRQVQDSGVARALGGVVDSLLDEVLRAPAVTGLGALKAHTSYVFAHCLDVALTAIVLGRKLHFPRAVLRDLALGCLVHDVGMLFLEPKLLAKPARLSAAEYAQVELHPTLGFELLRVLQPAEILANHVAYQHHERQDGLGYPRGLRGDNRVAREGVSGPGRIVLIGELAAVADVYDALSAERPHRGALPPEQVAARLQELAGAALNREIVAQVLLTVPLYPVCSEVVVTAGRYRGWRGIVARLNRDQLQRPVVRLLADEQGRRVSGPELDLAREGEVEVAAAAA